MKLKARIGSVISWPESTGIAPFEIYYFCCDFDVYLWRGGVRFSRRFQNQIFKDVTEIPDTGSDIEIEFNEMTGEISLL